MDSTAPPEPSTPKRKRLTRDQRRDILLMRRLGHSYEFIAKFIGVSQRAVQYTCNTQRSTPQHKNAGRPSRSSKEKADRREEYMTQSLEARRIIYLQLAEEVCPEGVVGPDSFRYALLSRGYRRRVALRKPPLFEMHRIARLDWAQEHVNWTEEHVIFDYSGPRLSTASGRVSPFRMFLHAKGAFFGPLSPM
jgi:hypothetical protein